MRFSGAHKAKRAAWKCRPFSMPFRRKLFRGSFRSRSGCFFRLLLGFSGTFLCLLAGQRLGRVVAGRTLGKAGLVEEAQEFINARNKIGPPLRIGVLRQNLSRFAHRDVFIEGLIKARVPE